MATTAPFQLELEDKLVARGAKPLAVSRRCVFCFSDLCDLPALTVYHPSILIDHTPLPSPAVWPH